MQARGVVEVAREVHEGLISAVKSQKADLMLVGYSAADTEDVRAQARDKAERIFDRIMYRVARGAGIDLIVAKFRRPAARSIMLPVLRGLNLPVSGVVLRALLAADDARVLFVRAVEPDADVEQQQQDLNRVLDEHHLDELGDAEIISSPDPRAALIERASEYDMAIIGAERPTIVDAIFGNIAERVASEASCSALLVRAARKC
jgi:nucleotide-binding universal stress UspA family protein